MKKEDCCNQLKCLGNNCKECSSERGTCRSRRDCCSNLECKMRKCKTKTKCKSCGSTPCCKGTCARVRKRKKWKYKCRGRLDLLYLKM